MRFIGSPQEHEDNLQYIYKETKTVVIASVLWASVLQCIRPLRWLPAYSLKIPRFIDAPQEHEDNLQYIYKETKQLMFTSLSLGYPKGRLENRA